MTQDQGWSVLNQRDAPVHAVGEACTPESWHTVRQKICTLSAHRLKTFLPKPMTFCDVAGAGAGLVMHVRVANHH